MAAKSGVFKKKGAPLDQINAFLACVTNLIVLVTAIHSLATVSPGGIMDADLELCCSAQITRSMVQY